MRKCLNDSGGIFIAFFGLMLYYPEMRNINTLMIIGITFFMYEISLLWRIPNHLWEEISAIPDIEQQKKLLRVYYTPSEKELHRSLRTNIILLHIKSTLVESLWVFPFYGLTSSIYGHNLVIMLAMLIQIVFIACRYETIYDARVKILNMEYNK